MTLNTNAQDIFDKVKAGDIELAFASRAAGGRP